ncbi:5-(carboxyamino)imidazole ribonucleotide mutase [Thermoanaerobacter brockii subsp. lactiethylicus]|jgi:5-(carboxyamino)imidazole ribonucleotide mutase|nr:phosphoribosylaminoimidazole carboxylase, catalytic subunit [Thermoanaerobacter sp.]MDI3501343.1 5-(carboxyamino)imidazole ribonucleotide mutase [Thermoanaerobacter sp.]MDI3529320.1 5-(carboxyamino)imidazole ribonucleotide mutase [Thermoanaerobacter sp.]HCD10282.1 5-(carboxyamino)imidazole ribonucleotide mutase [Thermoanaerobacter sp.]
MKKPLAGIIMGSDSDLPVMKEAAKVLEDFGVEYEITIVSAHRTPERMFKYAKEAEQRGIDVIIAGAGGAAHLPGMVAAISSLPVIGVPVKTSSLNGLDSLLSIVQMPAGVPVATVAINNAKNAGILAAEILGIKYPEIREKIIEFKEKMRKEVEEKAKDLENIGYEEYLGRRQNA